MRPLATLLLLSLAGLQLPVAAGAHASQRPCSLRRMMQLAVRRSLHSLLPPACAMSGSGSHLQHHLLFIAQVHCRQFGILLTPLGNVLLIVLVTLQKMLLAKVSQNLDRPARASARGCPPDRSGLSPKSASESFCAVRVQFLQQALINRHPRLAQRRRVAGVDPVTTGNE